MVRIFLFFFCFLFLLVVDVKIVKAKNTEWYFQQTKQKFAQSKQKRGIEKTQKLEEATLLSNTLFHQNFSNFYQSSNQKKKLATQTASLYYQRKDFANALYFFRLAQLFTPFNTKVQENILNIKRKLAEDPDLQKDNFITPSLIFLKFNFFSMVWLVAFIGILNVFFWIMVGIFYFKRQLKKKQFFKILTTTLLTFLLVFFGSGLWKKSQENNLAIAKYETNLYQGPGIFFTKLASVPQGEEFKIEKQKETWLQVKTATNQYYWVNKQNIFIY